MQYLLYNPDCNESLYPFSQLRSFGDIRIGMWTIAERYQKISGHIIYENNKTGIENELVIFVNTAFIPDHYLADQILNLKQNEALLFQSRCAAICVFGKDFKGFQSSRYTTLTYKNIEESVSLLNHSLDIIRLNTSMLADDIHLLDMPDVSRQLAAHNKITGSGIVVAEEGVEISGAYLNTESGPIYLGKNVQVMEGVCIRGPVAILDDAIVKMGATIYGATTIGRKCIVGGEIKNSVFFDYSNKAHHGYIGDSVIGSWCNLGAGTSCSNVKNNAGDMQLWNPLLMQSVNVGMKCGVMMGDHTKTAINTSLNSGTVTGVCCNIVKAGFPSKYIPDFTWNVETGALYHETKLLEDVNRWMKMKNEVLDDKNKHLLLQLYKERINTSS